MITQWVKKIDVEVDRIFALALNLQFCIFGG